MPTALTPRSFATNLYAFGASDAPAKASRLFVVARKFDLTQIRIARQAGLVSVLCLVAIPITLCTTAGGWVRGQGRPQVALWITATLAASAPHCTFLSAPYGLFQLAAVYVSVTIGLMLIGALYTGHGDLFPSAIQVQP